MTKCSKKGHNYRKLTDSRLFCKRCGQTHDLAHEWTFAPAYYPANYWPYPFNPYFNPPNPWDTITTWGGAGSTFTMIDTVNGPAELNWTPERGGHNA